MEWGFAVSEVVSVAHDHDAVCACVAEHRPPVLEFQRHHVLPFYLGGEDVDSNLVWLCSTTHSNVHELLRLMLKAGDVMTDRELQVLYDRPVSRYAAVLARDGFTRWRTRTVSTPAR